MAVVLFLLGSMGAALAGQYSFSGYGVGLFGKTDRSRMCTVDFSVDGSSPEGEVGAVFRVINTGDAPVKADPFFSQKAEVVSKDGKTYEVTWYSGKVELKDGRVFEIPGKVTPEKVQDIVANHPEFRRTSDFEELSTRAKWGEDENAKKKKPQLINPGGAVERVFYSKDPLIRKLIAARNVDQVIFYSGMGKFVLRQEQ